MCGIAGAFCMESEDQLGVVEPMIRDLGHRGPDHTAVVRRGSGHPSWVGLGHSRLSIVDPDPRSNQPFVYGSTAVVFNGEIWNWREVREDLEAEGHAFRTGGDTEVVAAALDAWGEDALPQLNGMFALAWTTDGFWLRLARDRYGEVPLHVAPLGVDGLVFASELKAIPVRSMDAARWVQPGTVLTISALGVEVVRYAHTEPDPSHSPAGIELDGAAATVGNLLADSCREREMADVPVCTMLSGGVDSAAIASLLSDNVPGLVAYTAVMDPKSRDLRMAREAAEYCGLELVEVRVPEPTADDLARVVREIEQPHKAQVEIGWACLHLAERMRADGFKVTYSGEGSDELWGSYGFAYHALGDNPTDREFSRYRHRLFTAQHRKNFARANKAFMTAGVECRLPFLNPGLVSYALSLPRSAVADGKSRPKAVLQRAVAERSLVPSKVATRPKVAFQDGMKMKDAAARAVANPKRFYNAEYGRCYGRAA